MTVTKAQYKEIQKEIKESSLQDFHDWVAEWADKMQSANAVGDTHKVFDGVKALRGKRERPPCNLSTDAQGAPLDDAAAATQVWKEFLSDEFAATEVEARSQTPGHGRNTHHPRRVRTISNSAKYFTTCRNVQREGVRAGRHTGHNL